MYTAVFNVVRKLVPWYSKDADTVRVLSEQNAYLESRLAHYQHMLANVTEESNKTWEMVRGLQATLTGPDGVQAWKDRATVEQDLRMNLEKAIHNLLGGGSGLVLVPIEPTYEMCLAGTLVDGVPQDPAGAWRRMVAAAPVPSPLVQRW